MSERWEEAIQEWYTKSHTSNLEYLDLALTLKVSSNQIAHNLSVVYDRTCLSAKINLRNFKLILERSEILEKDDIGLKTALKNLTTVFLENRPLTKQEVKELVAEISRQPKLVEEEAIRLTEELSKKLDRVEKLLHQVER